MPKRICSRCHHLYDATTTRGWKCPACRTTTEQQRDQQRGTRQQRGYNAEYDRNRTIIIQTAITAARAGHPQPCWICRKPCLATHNLTAEHKTPLRNGGTSQLANLAPAHAACNYGWRRRPTRPRRMVTLALPASNQPGSSYPAAAGERTSQPAGPGREGRQGKATQSDV